jgi:antitoxin HicB
MKKVHYHFNLVLRPEPEGGFTVSVPALPGCVTYGRALEESREMARDAVSGYIASLGKHGDPIPTESESRVTSLDVEYAQTVGR